MIDVPSALNRLFRQYILITLAIFATSSSAVFAEPRIVVDVSSGRIVEHQEAFRRWYPASLTKLMTAYVAFRAVKSGELTMRSPVVVTKNAANEPPSKMYFPVGTELTLDAALKIIMVKSANDVSTAIAESVAGSEPAFIQRMNAEAKRLGMIGSRFINAHGLPGKGQYTTARDMALLGVALKREFPQYANYFRLEGVKTAKKSYSNYNILIGRFPGADGMKTGFICSSGFNQVSSATRNGKSVVSVVFGARSQEHRAEESARLLQKGLGSSSFGKPTLKNLAPYGDGQRSITDLRPVICSEAARKSRYEGRDVEGRMVLKSPYIKAMSREPRFVSVSLGGTVGQAKVSASNIPIPTPKPAELANRTIASTGPVTSSASVASPGFTVPVPTPRPRL